MGTGFRKKFSKRMPDGTNCLDVDNIDTEDWVTVVKEQVKAN